MASGYNSSPGRPPSFAGPGFVFFGALALWAALLLLFNMVPGIDLSIARGVFTVLPCSGPDAGGKTCGEFAYAKLPLFAGFRTFSFYLPYVAAGALLLSLAKVVYLRGSRWHSPQFDLHLAALISFVLGCGLIVNSFLKEFVGRPRPRDTELFGGTLDFVPAGSFSGECLSNCSFVSGEGAAGGWLFCLLLLLPLRLRPILGLPLLAVSILMPTLRVVTGAHYLSDTLLGWLSSVVVFTGILALFVRLGSAAPVVAAVAAAEELESATRFWRWAGRAFSRLLRRAVNRRAQGWRVLAARPVLAAAGSRFIWQRPVVVLAVALAVSAFLFLRIDYPLGVWMRSFPKDINGIVQWISALGTGKIVLVPTGLILALRAFAPLERLPSRLKNGVSAATACASYLFLSTAGGGLMASLVKNVIGRARPSSLQIAAADHFQPFAFDPDFASFPSGHSATAGAMAFALALAFPLSRPFVLTVGVLICLSRQMVGAHWASDTVMGWAVGGAFALWLAHVFARRKLVFTYGAEGQLLPLR